MFHEVGEHGLPGRRRVWCRLGAGRDRNSDQHLTVPFSDAHQTDRLRAPHHRDHGLCRRPIQLCTITFGELGPHQATRTISRKDATRDIPIIMCTSKGQDTDKIWGMRQGALAYLVKPVDHDELLARIRAMG